MKRRLENLFEKKKNGAAVVCAIWFPAWEVAAGLLAMTVVNAAIAVLVLWLCRNLLQYAELNSR